MSVPTYKISPFTWVAGLLALSACNGGIAPSTPSPAPAVPTVSLSASDVTPMSGGSSTLTWFSSNATSCVASNTAANNAWTGTKIASASPTSQTLTHLTISGTYTLTCTGNGGSASRTVTITVGAVVDPPPDALSGNVDSSYIANLQTNAIYIYAGTVTPDDLGGSGAQPIKIVPVTQNTGACSWRYSAGTLADGQYTLAFTNQAATDNPATNDAMVFQRVAVVTVVGGTANYDFTPTRLLTVGHGKMYPNVLAAAAAVQNGDVIEIDAGQYDDNIVVWRANNITLRGVGGRAHLHATKLIPYSGSDLENGMGIWVTKGSNIKIESIEFSNAAVDDKNGAGIRAEGANLTVCNSYFHDNENGILGGAGTVLIEYSEFAFNGGCVPTFGCSHNLYIANIDKLVFQYNYSHHANIGHLLKSRAKENHILYNRLTGESGTSSYEVEVPDGGLTYLIGNLIQQGPQTDNSTMVSYAIESATNPLQQLSAINNTLVNENGSGTFISIRPGTTAQVTNNLFVGTGTAVSGPATQISNLSTNTPLFVNQGAFDYRRTSSSPGSDPGISSTGFVLAPMFQYVHPHNREARPINGAPNIGAYE
jgi:hypothetical protein